MNPTPPEAKNEYSRSRGAGGRSDRRLAGVVRLGGLVVPGGAIVGALLLVVAEFSPLYRVHLVTSQTPVQSVSTGSHNAYALIVVGVVAAMLGLAWRRGSGRPAALAIAALGLLSLLIALIGDLPDTHAKGLTSHAVLASTSAAAGIYVETLGAIVLLLSGGLGLLGSLAFGRPGQRPPRDASAGRRMPAGRLRSGS